jgi:hypothetical protein
MERSFDRNEIGCRHKRQTERKVSAQAVIRKIKTFDIYTFTRDLNIFALQK